MYVWTASQPCDSTDVSGDLESFWHHECSENELYPELKWLRVQTDIRPNVLLDLL
jgi:hypothetical protein